MIEEKTHTSSQGFEYDPIKGSWEIQQNPDAGPGAWEVKYDRMAGVDALVVPAQGSAENGVPAYWLDPRITVTANGVVFTADNIATVDHNDPRLFATDYVAPREIAYKYDEGKFIAELSAYVDSTYTEHYAQGKLQATEFIIDSGYGDGHCLGNIMKYARRYGKKSGYNKKDLMKILHYALIQLHVHEFEGRK